MHCELHCPEARAAASHPCQRKYGRVTLSSTRVSVADVTLAGSPATLTSTVVVLRGRGSPPSASGQKLLAKICSPRVPVLAALEFTVAQTEIGDEGSACPVVRTGSRAQPASFSSWKARYAGLATFCGLPPARFTSDEADEPVFSDGAQRNRRSCVAHVSSPKPPEKGVPPSQSSSKMSLIVHQEKTSMEEVSISGIVWKMNWSRQAAEETWSALLRKQ